MLAACSSGSIPPSPEQMPVPASSAPRASAILASSLSEPKLMSETKQRDRQPQRLLRPRADDQLGGHRRVVEERQPVELGGDELEVVPARQLGGRHAHGAPRAVVADLGEPLAGQPLDVGVVRLLGGAVGVLVEAEVVVAPVGLGVALGPAADLGLVDVDGVVAGVDPGREAGEGLGVVVLADPGVVAVVPAVDAADEVGAVDVAVGQQGAAVEAAAEEDGDLVVVADDDQVDAGDQGVGGLAVGAARTRWRPWRGLRGWRGGRRVAVLAWRSPGRSEVAAARGLGA